MAIRVTCACGGTLRAKDEHAGRKGKCPRCGAVLRIPEPPPETDFYNLAEELDSPDFNRPAGRSAGEAAAGGSGATASADGAFTSAGLTLRTKVDVSEFLDHDIEKIIVENLQRHVALMQRETPCKVDIEVTVIEWDEDVENPSAAIHVFGTVNGVEISRAFKSALVLPFFGGVFVNSKDPEVEPNIAIVQQRQLEGALDKACIALDRMVGKSLAITSYLWTPLNVLNHIIGIAVGIWVGMSIWDALPPGRYLQILIILPGVIVWLALAFLGTGIVCAVMPDSFFRRDPRGRRVLQWYGAKTPNGLRAKALTIPSVVLGVCLLGYVFISDCLRNGDKEERRVEAPKDPHVPGIPEHVPPPHADFQPPEPVTDRLDPPRAPAEPEEPPKRPSRPKDSPFPTAPFKPPPIPGRGPGFGP